MEVIKTFYGQHSFLYLGTLSHGQREWWRESTTSCPPESRTLTSRHHVGESRRRISREVNKMCLNLPMERKSRENTRSRVITKSILVPCTKAGHLQGVRRAEMYLRRKGLRPCSNRYFSLIDAAAKSGSIPLVEHFRRNGHAIGTSTMVSSVHAKNSVEVVKWLLVNGCKVEEDVVVEAASIGNVAVLEVLSVQSELLGLGFSQKVMTYAGKGGSIDTVNFLKKTFGLKLTPALFAMAAFFGRLDLMKYLKSQGCRWDKRVCWMAAHNGHLEALKWARSERCPWDPKLALEVAKKWNHTQVVDYLEIEKL